MQQNMIIQTVLPGSPVATMGAPVRLLPRVDNSVSLEVKVSAKLFAANVADVSMLLLVKLEIFQFEIH